MKTFINIITFLFCTGAIFSQHTISGKITDAKNNPIEGANIYLEGTYDGASSDINGNFSFETSEEGTQTLVVSMLSFEPHHEVGDVSYFENLHIKDINCIGAHIGQVRTY